MSKEKSMGRPKGSKGKQRVCIEFENFQILGVHGDFILQRIAGDFVWSDKKQDYVFRKNPGEIVVGRGYHCSLYDCLNAMQKYYWDELKIGADDNWIEEFWELKAVAERIDNRLAKAMKKCGIVSKKKKVKA